MAFASCQVFNAAKDAEAISSFQREARLALNLAHDNVVPTLAVCLTPPQLAIVMPWFDHSLADALFGEESKRLAPQLTAARRFEIACDIASGLAFLHGGDPIVVHGDLKPDNVMLNKHLQAKLADFGQSRIHQTARTTTAGLQGTVAYMAPELLTAEGKPSPSSDIYR